MVMYSVLRVLHGYVHEDGFYTDLLRQNALFFISAVNYDGFKYISHKYKETGRLEFIRKNRHIYREMEVCNAEQQGVDLNRNYGYKFAHDNRGSSGVPCGEDYRGPSGFSEPETQAMKNLIESYP